MPVAKSQHHAAYTNQEYESCSHAAKALAGATTGAAIATRSARHKTMAEMTSAVPSFFLRAERSPSRRRRNVPYRTRYTIALMQKSATITTALIDSQDITVDILLFNVKMTGPPT